MTKISIPSISPKWIEVKNLSPVIAVDIIELQIDDFTEEEKETILALFPVDPKTKMRRYKLPRTSSVEIASEGKSFFHYHGDRSVFWESHLPAVLYHVKTGLEASLPEEIVPAIKDLKVTNYVATDSRLFWYETFEHFLQYRSNWGTLYYALIHSPSALLMKLNLEEIAVRFDFKKQLKYLENGQITKLHSSTDPETIRKAEQLYQFLLKKKAYQGNLS